MSCLLAPVAVATILAPCLFVPGDVGEITTVDESEGIYEPTVEMVLGFCFGLAVGLLLRLGRNDEWRDRTGVVSDIRSSCRGKARSARRGDRTSGQEVVSARVRKRIEKKASGLGMRIQPLMSSIYVQGKGEANE